MPQYKIVYFPIRGLAEMARLLFVDNNIEFEDEHIKTGTWQKIKPQFVNAAIIRSLPSLVLSQTFGQVPCLLDDGQQMPQTGAFMRYLARKHGESSAFPVIYASLCQVSMATRRKTPFKRISSSKA